ncbi:MAG: NAD-dependent deacylase [Alistipes sp.]|nr:NAD-dependent deacylase [Alistipes sp.]MBO7265455.1 NAD-dependent deacylase [Alistipes sp.]MBO7286384.1 NAD-dependent deacylase [Alistipes sp.]
MEKKRIVVFTGAGVSADSGIATFRDSDGLWANYRIEEVCTPEALKSNRAKVVEFYNMRRREALTKEPNAGHYAIAKMEEWADVCVITQNVDNLHERAGSTRVVHLHGELMKLRSERNPELIYDINEGWEQALDARGEDGALLRPHIVFFGESVPMFDAACKIVEHADILIVVGTSLAVYPAASLVYYVRDRQVPIYLVDPGTPDTAMIRNPLTHIKERGSVGVPQLIEELRNELTK